ncbi:hypothetical protein OIV83_002544 [Microbotryomycetes sp. JL201]|nr:hypothetical protein OIV83_002544 [Microbotryomycetes sp. JL201]
MASHDEAYYGLDGDGLFNVYSSGGSSDLFYTPECSDVGLDMSHDDTESFYPGVSMPGAFVDEQYAPSGAIYGSPLDFARVPRSYWSEPMYTHDHSRVPFPEAELFLRTHWAPPEMPLHEAWGDELSWSADNWALADLMHYQRRLELDTALNEAERLSWWEERLRWEQLHDDERQRRYQNMNTTLRDALGLSSGYWGSIHGSFHGRDLSYLRNLTLSRELFPAAYRSSWMQYPGLHRRFMPYLSPSSRLPHRLFSRPRRSSTMDYIATPPGIPSRHTQAAEPELRSTSLSNESAINLREQELRLLLRNAELRSSLTSLSTTERARALEEARQLKQQIDDERRLARGIDRQERFSDAVARARHILEAQRGVERELEMRRELRACRSL